MKIQRLSYILRAEPSEPNEQPLSPTNEQDGVSARSARDASKMNTLSLVRHERENLNARLVRLFANLACKSPKFGYPEFL